MIVTFVALGFLGVFTFPVNSQTPPSECPPIPTMRNFDVSKYMGVWYEQATYSDAKDTNTKSKCVFYEYSLKDNNITVRRSRYDKVDKKTKTMTANIRIPNPADRSKQKITFPNKPEIPEGDYKIVDTDYDHISLVYSCNKIGDSIRTKAWVRTRVRRPPEQFITAGTTVAKSLNIDPSLFVRTSQKKCKK